MLPEALSKFIDELLEGKDPSVSAILREHPVSRDEFTELVRTAVLTYAALSSIGIPEGAEAESRLRAVKLMAQGAEASETEGPLPAEAEEGLLNRIRTLLQDKFRKS